MLYIPLGDGGAGGDPERNGDDPFTLLGSLLRIDPTASPDAPYSIPADNPFADYDIVYVPYCDGSVFTGDATVDYGGVTTYHHGLRNLTVAVDALVENFPELDASLYSARGMGEARPLATNETPEGRQENRRVEFHEID